MKKLILMGTVVLILFGISAFASWLLQHGSTGGGEHADSGETSADKGHKANTPELRQVIRAPFNPDADSAAQVAATLKTQAETLKARDQQFVARQKSLEIICKNIRDERSSIEELRNQCGEEMRALADKLAVVERKSGEVDAKNTAAAGKLKDITESMWRVEESERENLKRLGTVFDTMDAQAAADSLQHMSDTGKLEMAAKILTSMQQRQSAKVLAEFRDKTTVVQLLEKMGKLDRPNLSAKTPQ